MEPTQATSRIWQDRPTFALFGRLLQERHEHRQGQRFHIHAVQPGKLGLAGADSRRWIVDISQSLQHEERFIFELQEKFGTEKASSCIQNGPLEAVTRVGMRKWVKSKLIHSGNT
jgi:hypothetical protein